MKEKLSILLVVMLGFALHAAEKKADYKCDKTDKPCKSDKICKTADIVDNAVASGKFKTLVTAVKAANLVETLKSEGPFTVLAPSDAAFARLPKATMDKILSCQNTLGSILKYHVISGEVKSDAVVKLDSAKTVNGKDVNIKVVDGKVYINDAMVTTTDIKCKNGVIHIIDTVLIPKS